MDLKPLKGFESYRYRSNPHARNSRVQQKTRSTPRLMQDVREIDRLIRVDSFFIDRDCAVVAENRVRATQARLIRFLSSY